MIVPGGKRLLERHLAPLGRRRAEATLLVAAWLCAPIASAAQDVRPVAVPEPVSCPHCRIDLGATIQISDSIDALVKGLQAVKVDQSGRIWVLGGEEPPRVFTSAGAFLRIVGRRGSGPGEYGRPRDVVSLAGDSVLVIDVGPRRASVLDPTLTFVRSVALPHTPSSTQPIAWPSRVVTGGYLGSASGAGLPLHEIDFRTSPAPVVQSFGSESGELLANDFGAMARYLTLSSAGGLWTADELLYRLAKVSEDGHIDRVLVRESPWFPGRTARVIGTPSIAPSPSISGVHEDRDGLLWVSLRVASANWQEAWPRAGGEIDYRQLDLERLFDSVVEVIDPRTARVVARRQFDEWIVSMSPGARIARLSVDGAGAARILINELRLVRP
jgi:hypothetical protein